MMWRTLLAAAAVVMSISSASATGCIADKEGVKRLYPDSWASYTYRMEGHKDEKCWFPAPDKYHKKWNPKYEDKTPDIAFSHLKTSRLNAFKTLKKLARAVKHIEKPVYDVPHIDVLLDGKVNFTPSEEIDICNHTSSMTGNLQDLLQGYVKKKYTEVANK